MVEPASQRRFRLSIRTLMVAVALCALLLAFAAWTVRQAQMRAMMERAMAEEARAQALLARDLAQREATQREAAQSTLAAAKLGTADQKKAGSLWAGLTVNHPIFRAGQAKDLRIEFTLVNDGDQVINPKIPESRIVINGKELSESGIILSRVEEGSRFKALPPGESLQFDCLLGDQFKQPGVYRFSWKGVGFQSSEIVLRILPEGTR